jgi:hypothetical protein
MSIDPVTGFSVLPVDGVYVDRGCADWVRRGVGEGVGLCVGVADGVGFGVGAGVWVGGVVGSTQPMGGHVGSGSALGLGDCVAVGLGDAAVAVPEGNSTASGTRTHAATERRARRLGADVGTGRS